jgi:hypothetical protein
VDSYIWLLVNILPALLDESSRFLEATVDTIGLFSSRELDCYMVKEMDHDGHHLQLFFLPVGVMFCVDQLSPPPPLQQQYNSRHLLPSMDAVVDRRATTTSTNIVGGTTVGGVTATVQRRPQSWERYCDDCDAVIAMIEIIL